MNNSTNISSSDQLIRKAIAFFCLADFIICSTLTILITQTVWKDSALKKEVRFFLLCHHLIYLALFFGLATIFYMFRAFQVNAPILFCWILFAVQISIGRGVLLTLVLMAVNTCIAVCWPLKYQGFVHSVKIKIMVSIWIIALLHPTVSLVYESIKATPEVIVSWNSSCPTTLNGIISRIAGMVFIVVIVILIVICYILIYIEGRRAGHFNRSNKQARRTIIIHGLQVILHIVPTLMNIWIANKPQYLPLSLVNFIIFSFAQCLSPVVYGLRCTQLRHKFIVQRHCCAVNLSDSNSSEQFRNNYADE
ncbi:odorant receptor 131-2-like isoform 1-T2 [Discoglossus pictus]